MKFIYLFPSPNKYYKIRDEEFVINELKKIGHEVIEINNFFSFNLILKFIINRPNAIIFSSLRIGKKINFILKIMLKFKISIYWWYFDSANADKKRLKSVKKVAKNVSIFFNRDKINFEVYKKIGIKPSWLDQGVPNILKYTTSDSIYDYDIGFFGSLSTAHHDRARLLKKIDKKYNLVIYSKDRKDFLNQGFKNVKDYVFKDLIHQKVARIKIILVLNASCASPYYWSDRIHIMLGSGAFCLTENIEGIEKSYIHNKHHIIFNDNNSLFNSINFWLNKDLDREKIRHNGYLHAQLKHTYTARASHLINYISALK